MKQTSIKSNKVADLLDQIISSTGESKVDAVTQALELRLKQINKQSKIERTKTWLETQVWENLAETNKGKAPSKEEQEEILGY